MAIMNTTRATVVMPKTRITVDMRATPPVMRSTVVIRTTPLVRGLTVVIKTKLLVMKSTVETLSARPLLAFLTRRRFVFSFSAGCKKHAPKYTDDLGSARTTHSSNKTENVRYPMEDAEDIYNAHAAAPEPKVVCTGGFYDHSATWSQTWKIGLGLWVKGSARETSVDWPVFCVSSASSDNEEVTQDVEVSSVLSGQ